MTLSIKYHKHCK